MLIKKEICNKLSDKEIIKKSLEVLNYFACLYERYEQKLLRYIKKISLANQVLISRVSLSMRCTIEPLS